MSAPCSLISLIDLDLETQLKVLKIRNEENIRKWMFSSNIIERDEHLAWIETLKTDRTQFCFVIFDEVQKPFGVINIKKIDKSNQTAELGFFRTQLSEKKGFITSSLITVIDYSFKGLGMEKIYSQVIENNIKSINIHKKLSFAEEGILRSHLVKEKTRIDIHLFGLLKTDWDNNKENIKSLLPLPVLQSR